jgi:hypothetical protein
MAEARRDRARAPVQSAVKAQIVVAIAILTIVPVRIKNLTDPYREERTNQRAPLASTMSRTFRNQPDVYNARAGAECDSLLLTQEMRITAPPRSRLLSDFDCAGLRTGSRPRTIARFDNGTSTQTKCKIDISAVCRAR